jgi:hypothetical protein
MPFPFPVSGITIPAIQFTLPILSPSYDKLIETENNSLVGDIAPYGDGELVKFIRTDLTGSAVAKPQFINKVFLPPTISNSSGLTASFYNNNSYTSTNLEPWYDNYTQYFSNIRGYSQDHSIIPEFIVSNYDNIAISETRVARSLRTDTTSYSTDFYGDTNYVKFNGREENSEVPTSVYEDIKIDSFIDKKSNKIKLVFNGIKKLLPYNGFYPSQYSQIIAKRFADSYFSSSLSSVEKQAMIQPLFGPGVFFNTIKAGIAMSYPANVKSSPSNTLTDIYVTGSGTLFEKQYFVSTGSLNSKFTFENLLKPAEVFRKSGSFNTYLEPTRYSDYFIQDPAKTLVPYYSGSEFIENANGRSYILTINNFLAETVNFFLQNSELTSFVSAPESEFKIPNSNGYSYGMKIKITKSDTFSMFSKQIVAGGSDFLTEDSLFGPQVWHGINIYAGGVLRTINTMSGRHQVPYAASRVKYPLIENLTGDSDNIITLYCSGLSTSQKPSIGEIFNNLYVATASSGEGGLGGGLKYNEYLNRYAGATDALYTIGAINTVLDSLNIKQKVADKQVTIDPKTGEQTLSTNTNANYRWVIQTKFESPLIDYSDISSSYVTSSATIACTGSDNVGRLAKLNVYEQSIDGIWNTRGTIPKDGQSVQIELYDDLFGDYSLFELCGFKKETKTISQLADQREISEAVLVLPYTKKAITDPKTKKTITLQENKDEPGKYFLPIDENKINTALGLPDYKKLSINKIKNILDTSPNIDAGSELVKLLKAMVKYNIPPHLNWLKDKTIKPFVIYIAEFSHTLDKQDLADIWQGNMPKIAQTPEEQQVVIEHMLDSDNFYDRATLDKYMAAGMYIKVFKVKQRGKMAYSEITAGAEDDAKFNTVFPDKWYSYNWPYDYFSLVELLNIKAGEVYENTGSV